MVNVIRDGVSGFIVSQPAAGFSHRPVLVSVHTGGLPNLVVGLRPQKHAVVGHVEFWLSSLVVAASDGHPERPSSSSCCGVVVDDVDDQVVVVEVRRM